MTVGSCLSVDRTAQVKVTNNGAGAKIEHGLHGVFDIGLGNMVRAEGVHHDGDGTCHADSVGKLHLALVGQPGSDHVLCHPTCRIGCRAVDLGAILAGEGATAMTTHAAVGIDDNLASSQAGIAHGPTYDKAASGVGVDLQVIGGLDALGLKHRVDDMLDKIGVDLLPCRLLGVLGGDEDLLDLGRLAVDIAHGHLGLAIGTKVLEGPVLADLGEALGETVGQIDWHGHKGRGLVAGISEHHALVTGTHLVDLVLALAVLGLKGFVDTLRDVSALLVDGVDDAAGVAVKAVLGAGVANLANGVADDLLDIHICLGTNLAGNDDKARGGHRLTRTAEVRRVGRDARGRDIACLGKLNLLGKYGVKDGVGDLVADLVRMALGHRLRGKQIVGCRSHW